MCVCVLRIHDGVYYVRTHTCTDAPLPSTLSIVVLPPDHPGNTSASCHVCGQGGNHELAQVSVLSAASFVLIIIWCIDPHTCVPPRDVGSLSLSLPLSLILCMCMCVRVCACPYLHFAHLPFWMAPYIRAGVVLCDVWCDCFQDVVSQYFAGWDWVGGTPDRNTGLLQDVVLLLTGPVLLRDPVVATTLLGARRVSSLPSFRLCCVCVCVCVRVCMYVYVYVYVLYERNETNERRKKERETERETKRTKKQPASKKRERVCGSVRARMRS